VDALAVNNETTFRVLCTSPGAKLKMKDKPDRSRHVSKNVLQQWHLDLETKTGSSRKNKFLR